MSYAPLSRGRYIDFRTSNGSIDAQGIHAENKLAIKASNGRLKVGLVSARNTSWADITTTNGRVDLSLPSSLNASISANTTVGRITGDSWSAHSPGLRGESACMLLGDDDMKMKVEAVNGSIFARVLQ